MKLKLVFASFVVIASTTAFAGVADPDCDATKAAKSAAMKSTVGVSGRCSASETAKDMGKDAAGIEDKGAIEKKRDNKGPAGKAKNKVLD